MTGAAGLIGGAVTRLLAARGEQVIAGDDFSIGTWQGAAEHVRWERLDVAAPDLADRLSHDAPRAVVHCAAHPGGRSMAEPAADVRVNAFGSMQVFEWCARHGVPVIYTSSSAVYGEQPSRPIREDAPLRPGTVYAACKVACEQFLRVLQAGYGLQWTTLRLFATYGAGHVPGTSQGIVNVMLTQLLAGDRLVVRGSLDRVRDLVYVDDAAAAIVACLDTPATRGATLNVGSGRELTVRQLVGVLCEAIGRPAAALRIEEAAGPPGDPHYSVADAGALRDATGVTPRVPFEEGIARLVAARLAS